MFIVLLQYQYMKNVLGIIPSYNYSKCEQNIYKTDWVIAIFVFVKFDKLRRPSSIGLAPKVH